MASIENTLAEIEKSDIPELNAGPDAFDAWIQQPDAVRVGWGWMKTAIKEEVIFTDAMRDCSTVVVCTNYDETTGTYAERSLMHALGSSVTDSDASEQVRELVRLASESSGKPRCIIALGSSVADTHFRTIANQQVPSSEGGLFKPFVVLQQLCDTIILERIRAIAIRPDGACAVLRGDGYSHQG